VSAPLHVIKLGSRTIMQSRGVHDDLAHLAASGGRILLVAGGALAIERTYVGRGLPVVMLELGNGDRVRRCGAADLPLIADAYRELVLPRLARELGVRGLSVDLRMAADGRVVVGARRRPLRAAVDGRPTVVRDHLVGDVCEIDRAELAFRLSRHDVVGLSPPIAGYEDELLNIDADALAASLAVAMGAASVRFVTSTAGVLRDPRMPASTLACLQIGAGTPFVSGRMRQKIRAAVTAATACPDVAIVGPDALLCPAGTTRVVSVRRGDGMT
jgi:acetylornithine deacetylase